MGFWKKINLKIRVVPAGDRIISAFLLLFFFLSNLAVISERSDRVLTSCHQPPRREAERNGGEEIPVRLLDMVYHHRHRETGCQTDSVRARGGGGREREREWRELRGANPREPPQASLIKLQQSVRQTGRHGDRLIEAESLGV